MRGGGEWGEGQEATYFASRMTWTGAMAAFSRSSCSVYSTDAASDAEHTYSTASASRSMSSTMYGYDAADANPQSQKENLSCHLGPSKI